MKSDAWISNYTWTYFEILPRASRLTPATFWWYFVAKVLSPAGYSTAFYRRVRTRRWKAIKSQVDLAKAPPRINRGLERFFLRTGANVPRQETKLGYNALQNRRKTVKNGPDLSFFLGRQYVSYGHVAVDRNTYRDMVAQICTINVLAWMAIICINLVS